MRLGAKAGGGGLGKVTSYQSARGWGELEPGGDELPAKRGTAHLGDCVDHDPRDDLMHGSRIAPGECGQHLAAVNGAEDAGDTRHQYRGRGGAERGLERSCEGGGMGRDQKTPVTHGVDLSRGSGRARGGKAGCTHPELYASLLHLGFLLGRGHFCHRITVFPSFGNPQGVLHPGICEASAGQTAQDTHLGQ